MNGIDRIHGAGETQGPEPADPGEGAKKPSGDFDRHLGPTGETSGTAGAAGASETAFSTMQARIREGLDRDLDRGAILRHVVEDEVSRAFGPQADSKMADAVAAAFEDNEQLKSLFDRLYADATRDRE